MEKIRKIDVGTLHGYDSHSVFEDNIRKRSYMYFENGGHFDDSSHIFDLNGEHCYIVSKDDLDAYMDRKEDLEQMNCTPVWDENQRLTAKVKALEAENAYLTRINEDFFKERSKLVERNTKLKCMVDKFYCMTSAGEELRAANEKLAAKVDELNKRISHLKVILEHDENKMAALITENNKLRGTCNELNATVAKLRQDLAKFHGEHTVKFLYEGHVDNKHIIGWTEVSGEAYELTLLTPERKVHE